MIHSSMLSTLLSMAVVVYHLGDGLHDHHELGITCTYADEGLGMGAKVNLICSIPYVCALQWQWTVWVLGGLIHSGGSCLVHSFTLIHSSMLSTLWSML